MHLVLGAACYAGRHVAAALHGHVRVRTAEPGDDLARSMSGVEVVHLTAELRSPMRRPGRQRPHPLLVTLVGVARAAGVRRLVCLSSAHVLGFSREGRVSERSPPHPEHPYERAMAADESWLRGQDSPEVVVLRPAQGFGRGERLSSRLLERMMTGSLSLPGGGAAPRTFLAGGDLGRAFHAAALRGQPGCAYLVGGFRGSWLELLGSAAEALSLTPRLGGCSYDLAYLGACARLRTQAGRRCWPTPFLVDVLFRAHVVEDGWSRRELTWLPQARTFAEALTDAEEWCREVAGEIGPVPPPAPTPLAEA